MKIKLAVMGLLLLCLLPTAALAGSNEQALKWLGKMQTAMQQQTYEGVLVYDRGASMSSLKVLHRYKDGREQSRIIQLDGEKGEVLRDGQDVSCVLPGNRLVQLDRPAPQGPFSGAFSKKLIPKLDYYMMSVVGDDRVAGHDAIKIAVMAKDENRYHYLLWLERKTGLLVKSRLLGKEGKPLEGFQYTSLNLSPSISDDDLKPTLTGALIIHKTLPIVRKDANWSSAMQWKADWIPAGYESLSTSTGKESKGNSSGDAVQMYSDGLASFSIFIEKPGPGSMPEGASRVGGTLAYAHRLDKEQHDYMVTVIGDIPAQTAKKIAMGIVPVMSK